ncbi:hypothetical protein AGABI2DRAFT_71249 [Agaricus bisporus var. bisporus H97]|uniref:hypothetical protein n=1 Tax=Agaricus bisporus var. bisporus (strain H97 / ATCC MYA-4626 / FGSC 10389) TaxID=936046 RepID=UPI00029F5612|nr:hypothetical protein AGABI2DRAFT_71249 [Agaricus bisporus var. bisporus H97]EKV46280.1 hypothetical protein AGABI2DRAFT_71249 [Agaricus bisporus var. bisporus H97]
MRTASCTVHDVAFLNSRIINISPDTCIGLKSVYRKASVIIARNIQKDRLNEVGSRRFASDENKTLVDFYSIDREVGSAAAKKGKKSRQVPPAVIQKYIWNTCPSNTGMIPGKLQLCRGLPVLIKHNFATELCITNGQEAIVEGWQSKRVDEDIQALEVVFVKLINPPTTVRFDILPDNVVPITPVNTVFSCSIPNNNVTVTIDRCQIPILPNFAITDFASQGKTRTPNVVDLTHCCNHQYFYTCLSRGTSAASTIILKPFDSKLITKGGTKEATGYLRQELRALDILDEITKQRFEGKLLASVTGTFRMAVLRSFRMALPAHELQDIDEFQIVDIDLVSRLRETVRPNLLSRLPNTEARPIGAKWDAMNNSCAYDAILSMLFNVWNDTRHAGPTWTDNITPIFTELVRTFETVECPADLVTIRDAFRLTCHNINPVEFQWGHYLTDLFAVLSVLCGSSICGEIFHACPTCGCRNNGKSVSISHLVCPTLCSETNRDAVWISQMLLCSHLPDFDIFCDECLVNGHGRRYTLNVEITNFPPVLFIDTSSPKIQLDLSFDIGPVVYVLRGIVYHGNNHFTSRFLSAQGKWWYHDGIACGDRFTLESAFSPTSDLRSVTSTGATAAIALYVKQ